MVLTYFKAGTTEQAILSKKGDDRRIDWGYFYLCGKTSPDMNFEMGNYNEVKHEFAANGLLSASSEQKLTTRMSENMLVMACANQLGNVAGNPVSGNIMIGYDDLYAIQYFGENRMAWWKKDGQVTMDDALVSASSGFTQLRETCARFDNQLWNDAVKAGGENYAELCVLAFKQAIAAHKLIKDKEGNTVFLSKENFSNGSIGTVDVTYPSAPLFLLYNPDLLKGMMTPIFYFSESGKWTKPFAAHDVGTYPLANGQTYGGDMPVEESGNMLILTTAIAHAEGFDLALVEQANIKLRKQTFSLMDQFMENKASFDNILRASTNHEQIQLIFRPDTRWLSSYVTADRSKINQILTIIFDFFRQGDDSNTRVYGGIGIGLAIAKKISKILKGELKVVSEPEKGSTFSFSIPVELSDIKQ